MESEFDTGDSCLLYNGKKGFLVVREERSFWNDQSLASVCFLFHKEKYYRVGSTDDIGLLNDFRNTRLILIEKALKW